MLLIWLMIGLFIVPTLGLLLVSWILENINGRWPVAIGFILIIVALGIGK